MNDATDIIDAAYNLAVEARTRMAMAQRAYGRGNLRRLRQAHADMQKVIRAAAELAAAGFTISDQIEAELKRHRRVIE